MTYFCQNFINAKLSVQYTQNIHFVSDIRMNLAKRTSVVNRSRDYIHLRYIFPSQLGDGSQTALRESQELIKDRNQNNTKSSNTNNEMDVK